MRNKKLTAFAWKLKTAAIEMGAVEAKTVPAGEIVVDERVRLKCLVPLCSNYGVNLMCPPNILPVAEFKQIVACYQLALLLKIDGGAGLAPSELIEHHNLADAWKSTDNNTPGEPITDYVNNLKDSQYRVYKILGKLESMCLKQGYTLAAGLAAGGCHLCAKCAGPGSACLHPYMARPSAEGLGVDVITTAKKAGINLDFSGKDQASWLAILLVD